MGQLLHGSARKTAAVRRAIQRSQESLAKLAKRYGLNPKTVANWKKRSHLHDAPMGPKQCHSTVLTLEEEALIVAVRRHTLLPLDDCLYALQATLPHLTRSALHRCLQRHGISRLPNMASEKPGKKKFKAYPIGYFHIDIAEVRTAVVHLFATWCAQLRRDVQTTAAQATVLRTLAEEHAFPYLAAVGVLFQGWAVAMQGQAATGIAQIRQGLTAYRAIGGAVALPHYYALLAVAYARAGQPGEGLTVLAEALEAMRHSGDRFSEAELYRLRGSLLLRQSAAHGAEAEACFHQALTIARRQQARSPELRATISLSRLWQG